jgi:hypothetical protein
VDCCIIDCVIETIQSNGYTQFRILLIRSLLLTIFASFVTCNVFTVEFESGDLKVKCNVTRNTPDSY